MANNQVQNQEGKTVTYNAGGNEITLSAKAVKNFLVRGNGEVSDQEVMMFLSLCKYQELNPFVNEAYIVKFGNQPASLIVSKEAFMKRAESNPHYQGMKAGIIVERNDDLVELDGAVKMKSDELAGAWAKVYRDDRKEPITVRIAFEEFSKGQSTWKQQPMNMIRKTAVVNALREAFPNSLGAMYTEDDSHPQNYNVPADISEEVSQNANKETLDFEEQKPAQIENKAETVKTKPAEKEPETTKTEKPKADDVPDDLFNEDAF